MITYLSFDVFLEDFYISVNKIGRVIQDFF